MKDTSLPLTWNNRLAYLSEVFAPRLALVNFIILIPFSLIYYFYVAKGTIPQLPWKMQRTVPLIISAVLAIILALKLARKESPLKNNPGLIGALVCLLMVIAMAAVGIAQLRTRLDSAGQDLSMFETIVVCNYLIYFVTGGFLLSAILSVRRLIVWIFIFLSLFCLFYFNHNTMSITQTGQYSSYLFLGDAFAISGVLALALAVPRWRILILLLCLIVSFTLITRTAFVAFAISGIIWLTAGFTMKRLISVLIAFFLIAATLWILSLEIEKSQILRGYGSSRIDSPEEWKSKSDKVIISRISINGKNGLQIKDSSQNTVSCRAFPEGFECSKIEWDMIDAPPERIVIQVRTENGIKIIWYTFKRISGNGTLDPILSSLVRNNITYLYLTLPYRKGSASVEFKRDIRSDISLFPNEGELYFVSVIQIHGNATMMNMKIESEHGNSSLSRFYYYNFAQLLPRIKLIPKQMEILKKKWFLGDFCGQVKHFDGKIGNYMHNWLSFWMQYGIVPFLLFVILFFWQYIIIGREFFSVAKRNFNIETRRIKARFRYGYRKKREACYERLKLDNPALLVTFLLATFNLIEVVFARSYATPYIWLSMGMMPAYLAMRKAGALRNLTLKSQQAMAGREISH